MTGIVEVTYAEAECQVDEQELKELNKESDASFDERTPEQIVLDLLKNHAIDISVRNNPGKKNYFKVIWEDWDLEKLLDH